VNLKSFTNIFNFDPKKHLFLGIEEEYWLTDEQGNLVNKSVDLLLSGARKKLGIVWTKEKFLNDIWEKQTDSILSDLHFKVGLQPELPLSQIEINTTPPCPDLRAAWVNLLKQRMFLREIATSHKINVLPIGTPLFPFTAKIFPLPYYHKVKEIFADKIKKGFISGQHVHVGMSDEKKAIRVFNYLREYLPIILAISTNSPIAEGSNTSLQSSRYFKYRVVAGDVIPEPIASWQNYYSTLAIMKCLDDPTRNWKILRIHPYGTVEVRVADVQTTANEAIYIAALVNVLAYKALNTNHQPDFTDLRVMEKRLLNSAMYGLTQTEVKDSVLKIVKKLTSLAKELQIIDIWEELEAWVSSGQNGSARQLKYLAQCADDPAKLFSKIHREFVNEIK